MCAKEGWQENRRRAGKWELENQSRQPQTQRGGPWCMKDLGTVSDKGQQINVAGAWPTGGREQKIRPDFIPGRV